MDPFSFLVEASHQSCQTFAPTMPNQSYSPVMTTIPWSLFFFCQQRQWGCANIACFGWEFKVKDGCWILSGLPSQENSLERERISPFLVTWLGSAGTPQYPHLPRMSHWYGCTLFYTSLSLILLPFCFPTSSSFLSPGIFYEIQPITRSTKPFLIRISVTHSSCSLLVTPYHSVTERLEELECLVDKSFLCSSSPILILLSKT